MYLQQHHHDEELECQRSCFKKLRIVGTFIRCSAICGSPRTARRGTEWAGDLGRFDTLLTGHSVGLPPVGSPSAAQAHRESASTMCSTMCPGVPLNPLLRPLRLQQQVGPHPAGLLEEVEELRLGGSGRRPCSAPHVPPPRPLPSSGAVRCGADTRQGPLRRSSVHTASMPGSVPLSARLAAPVAWSAPPASHMKSR